jgi:hypothetical protein
MVEIIRIVCSEGLEKILAVKAMNALETTILWKLQQECTSQEALQCADQLGREQKYYEYNQESRQQLKAALNTEIDP